MVIRNLSNDFPWPYFFINQFLTIINTDDEIDAGPEYEGLMICDIEGKKEGVFVVRI